MQSMSALNATKRDLSEFVTVLSTDTKKAVSGASANIKGILQKVCEILLARFPGCLLGGGSGGHAPSVKFKYSEVGLKDCKLTTNKLLSIENNYQLLKILSPV